MKKIIVAIAILLLSGTAAAANGIGTQQACSTKPDPKLYSAWRIIDGKKCWYIGRRGKAKESLYWKQPTKEETSIMTPSRPTPSETEPLKDRIDHAIEAIENAQPQPPTQTVPLPPPKPIEPSWWERFWDWLGGLFK